MCVRYLVTENCTTYTILPVTTILLISRLVGIVKSLICGCSKLRHLVKVPFSLLQLVRNAPQST